MPGTMISKTHNQSLTQQDLAQTLSILHIWSPLLSIFSYCIIPQIIYKIFFSHLSITTFASYSLQPSISNAFLFSSGLRAFICSNISFVILSSPSLYVDFSPMIQTVPSSLNSNNIAVVPSWNPMSIPTLYLISVFF